MLALNEVFKQTIDRCWYGICALLILLLRARARAEKNFALHTRALVKYRRATLEEDRRHSLVDRDGWLVGELWREPFQFSFHLSANQ